MTELHPLATGYEKTLTSTAPQPRNGDGDYVGDQENIPDRKWGKPILDYFNVQEIPSTILP